MFIYCYCHYCPPFFQEQFLLFNSLLSFTCCLRSCSFPSDFIYPLFLLHLLRPIFLPSFLSFSYSSSLSFFHLLFFYSFYFSSFFPPSFLRYSLPLSLPLPHHPSQPHVAEEGSPVVEDFINQASASLGGKITISYFERWNLGQTEKPQTTTDQK